MLLEREGELDRLRAALRAAQEGDSSVILLAGPLGIGRTALLRELARTACAADVRVLRANAAPMERDFAFGVVRQLLDSLLSGATETERNRWARRPDRVARLMSGVDDLPTVHPPSAAAFEECLHGLRSLLADVSEHTPLLILVDDLQWADSSSLRWLARLAGQLEGLRVMLVWTLLDGDQGADPALVRQLVDATRTLRPAALSRDAVRAMILERCGVAGHEEYVRACHEVSRGNPLLLTSLLLGMEAQGHTVADEHADRVRALRPAGLRERLASHLRTRPRVVREVAVAVSAFGGQGDPALIRELAGVDEDGLGTARRALREAGLLTDAGELRFVHRVVQDAVESTLTVAERERRHAAAADLLYTNGRPTEQIADHLMATTAIGRPWATTVLRAAAATAIRQGAPERAARYLRRVLLSHRAQGHARAGLLVELATAEADFDPEACRRHVVQAIPLLATARDRAVAVLRIPPPLLGAVHSSTTELLRRAAEGLGPHAGLDGPTRELGLRLEARLRHYGHENPGELASSMERLHGLGQEPPVYSAAERELMTVLLFSATLTGRLPAAEAARTAGRILEREPVASGCANTVLPLVVATLFAAESVETVATWLSTEHRNRRRNPAGADAVLLFAERAFVLVSQSKPTLAREYVERALALPDANWREVSTIILSSVVLELRDPLLSEQVLARAGRRRPTGLALTASLRILRASVDAQRGLRAQALESLLACGRQLDVSGWRNSALFPWRPQAIGLYQRLGDSRSALRLAEEELAWARSWGAPAALGRALRLMGWLQGAQGVPLLREAVTVLRDSSFGLELARTLVLLGRQLGSGPEAEVVLREAGTLAAACGAPWLVERAEHGLGAPTEPKTAILTRSERKVITLVSRGLTNQEIADEFGVSSRAVEKHLTNCYRKLGISGRHELADTLPA
ncbi:helix-turn-helix transcriptional regulator [Streptomyces candidus]|uniref:DNA-binding CsgD family transcriptional regulator n=1 Tax=Streptomyces candidus TaxID=67283 RepID=A0A7X0HNV8_9ACTN|nr:helix-turn-helix transcriptional regulator [Streptomyces candidus]MBB6439792.1 DNA-binding CsgD family transcriptional regulator [Streptomyces candidus]GHH56898.1 LuxR family transcriptional regulator [Streptomyces candidus]